jgi:hypothetical protein
MARVGWSFFGPMKDSVIKISDADLDRLAGIALNENSSQLFRDETN